MTFPHQNELRKMLRWASQLIQRSFVLVVFILTPIASANASDDLREVFFERLDICNNSDIGAPDCDTNEVGKWLFFEDHVPAVWQFHQISVEAFAILDVLESLGRGILQFDAGEECLAYETAIATAETWNVWVKLPDNSSTQISVSFAILEQFLDNATIYMQSNCKF